MQTEIFWKILIQGNTSGTVVQNVDAQVCSIFELMRNMFDGLSSDKIVESGFDEYDKYYNLISKKVNYYDDQKSVLVEDSAVTKVNCSEYINVTRDKGIKAIDAKKKNVLMTAYSNNDNFLNTKYIPAINYYATLFNYNVTLLIGDGNQESSVISKIANVSDYDAYAFNCVSGNKASLYLDALSK